MSLSRKTNTDIIMTSQLLRSIDLKAVKFANLIIQSNLLQKPEKENQNKNYHKILLFDEIDKYIDARGSMSLLNNNNDTYNIDKEILTQIKEFFNADNIDLKTEIPKKYLYCLVYGCKCNFYSNF